MATLLCRLHHIHHAFFLINQAKKKRPQSVKYQGRLTPSAALTTATLAAVPRGLGAGVHLRKEILTAYLETRLDKVAISVSDPEHNTLDVLGTEVSEDGLEHLEGLGVVKNVLNGWEASGLLLTMNPQLISSHLLRVSVDLGTNQLKCGVTRRLSAVVVNEPSNGSVKELLHWRGLLGLPAKCRASVGVGLQRDEALRCLLPCLHSTARKPVAVSVTEHSGSITLECRDDVTTLSQSRVHKVADLLADGVKDLALALVVKGHVKDNGHLLHCCPFLLVIVARFVGVRLLVAPS